MFFGVWGLRGRGFDGLGVRVSRLGFWGLSFASSGVLGFGLLVLTGPWANKCRYPTRCR